VWWMRCCSFSLCPWKDVIWVELLPSHMFSSKLWHRQIVRPCRNMKWIASTIRGES
jgi:hypothetical protein